MGSDRALVVDQTNLATQLCQSKLNEVLTGSIPLNGSSSGGQLDECPGWEWSMDSQQGTVTGLYTVTIRVNRQGSSDKPIASLSQMVMDPALKGNNGAYATTTSNSSTTGNSGSTGGN
jgi:hypothetical protein